MRVKLQLVMCSDEGHAETVTDVITLNKNSQRIEHLGLTMAEAKQLLSALQRHLLQHQVDTFLDRCATCADCGALLKVKAHASRSFRTLFGTYKLSSRSCPSSLRIIPPTRESSNMPPLHHHRRGQCHDSTPLLLSADGLGTPVALCRVVSGVAKPQRASSTAAHSP